MIPSEIDSTTPWSEPGTPAWSGSTPTSPSCPRSSRSPVTPRPRAPERARAIGDFLCGIIDAAADKVPAVKPQSAFFEVFGADGVAEFERVVAASKDAGLLVIGDVKRGDIGSTAVAYGRAFLRGIEGQDPRATRFDHGESLPGVRFGGPDHR